MAQIIQLNDLRSLRNFDSSRYRTYINSLDMMDLLGKIVDFQSEVKHRIETNQDEFDLELLLQGLILFPAINKSANTQEMKFLTENYIKKLQYEYHTRMVMHSAI